MSLINQPEEPTLSTGIFTRVTRVVSYLFIGSALIVVTVAGDPLRQPLLYIVLAMGALLIPVGQDLLPITLLGRWRAAVAAGAALGFLTVLIILSGGYNSPFLLGYVLLLAGTSLWAQGIGPYVLAIAVFGTYLLGVLIAPEPLPQSAWGVVGFHIVALALTSYVASVIGREQRRAHYAALRLSRFDPLTELHSRSHFSVALEQEILRSARSGRPFSLLMLDLDGLKPVNDRFGHASGDRLLRSIAEVIRGGLRVTDLAARYGGDEFIVLLPETDGRGAQRVAEKLRGDIGQLVLPENGQMIHSTVSIGLVAYPDDGRSSSELLRRADAAMYEAKRRGRDRTVRYQVIGDKRPVPVVKAPPRSGQPVSGQPAPWDPLPLSVLATLDMPEFDGRASAGADDAAAPAPLPVEYLAPFEEQGPGSEPARPRWAPDTREAGRRR